jgi:hypothetical protein
MDDLVTLDDVNTEVEQLEPDWDNSIPDDLEDGGTGDERIYIALFNEFSYEDQEYYGMLTRCDMLFDNRAIYLGTGLAQNVSAPFDRLPYVKHNPGRETWVEVYAVTASLLKEIDDYVNFEEDIYYLDEVLIKPLASIFNNEFEACIYFQI